MDLNPRPLSPNFTRRIKRNSCPDADKFTFPHTRQCTMKRDNTRSHCLHCSPLNGGNDRERWEGKMRERKEEERMMMRDDGGKKREKKKKFRESSSSTVLVITLGASPSILSRVINSSIVVQPTT